MESEKMTAEEFRQRMRVVGKTITLADKSTVPKYKNKKVNCDGKIVDSTSEKKYAGHLELMVKHGCIHGFDEQVKLYFYYNGKKIFFLKLDFVVYLLDGTIDYLDNKGYNKKKDEFYTLPIFRLKKKLIEAQYGITIKEVHPNKAIYYTRPDIIKSKGVIPTIIVNKEKDFK